MKRRVAAASAALVLGAGLALAQRGRFDERFDALIRPGTAANIPYDGKFAFVRVTYDTLPGGFWSRGQPA